MQTDIFDEPKRVPGGQCGRILHHLQTIGPLTPLDALDLYGCFRLAGRIADLRGRGYRIDSPLVTLPSGKRVSSYRMFP